MKINVEKIISRSLYETKKRSERIKSTRAVAKNWVRANKNNWQLKDLCARSGGESCYYYGVDYGGYGGPGFGKVRAKLHGHEDETFSISELWREIEKPTLFTI